MADPATIAGVGIASQVGGSLLGAVGSATSGAAQQAQYQYLAGVAAVNQQIAKQNAAYATATGEVEAQQSGMATAAQIASTKAQQGASGLDVNRGSAVDVRASEADIGAENQAITRSNAARAAYGFEVEGVQAAAQGQVDIMQGQQAKTAGEFGVASSLLGGATSVSSKWLQASQQGISGF